jgi:hypothetical protein
MNSNARLCITSELNVLLVKLGSEPFVSCILCHYISSMFLALFPEEVR